MSTWGRTINSGMYIPEWEVAVHIWSAQSAESLGHLPAPVKQKRQEQWQYWTFVNLIPRPLYLGSCKIKNMGGAWVWDQT